MSDDKARHLFIFEGAKAEDKIFKKLEQNFMGRKHTIKCVYDAEVYQLYKQLSTDDFALDIVNLLKERSPRIAEELKDYDRDSFAFIYLFFDYDGHSSLADDGKIIELLDFFDNDTANGQMFISYPMVEALRHYRDMESFRDLTVKCKRANCPWLQECETVEDCLAEPHYKNFVSTDNRKSLSNINSYTFEVWKELIIAHLCKANYLVNDRFDMPEKLISQQTIFDRQLSGYISRRCPEVAVLSAFPLFILDYFGVEKLMARLFGEESDELSEDPASQPEGGSGSDKHSVVE